jgi:hypothetical protein
MAAHLAPGHFRELSLVVADLKSFVADTSNILVTILCKENVVSEKCSQTEPAWPCAVTTTYFFAALISTPGMLGNVK